MAAAPTATRGERGRAARGPFLGGGVRERVEGPERPPQSSAPELGVVRLPPSTL